MAKTTESSLQELNNRLDKAVDSTTNLIDAGTVMMWILIILTVLGFIAGIGKALANKNQSINGQKTDISKNNSPTKPNTKGGIILAIIVVIMFAIFAFASYCIFKYA